MSEAYSALAGWFEYLNADCDYDSWSQYLYRRLCDAGVAGGRGMDIGCGSGAFTRAFARRGFEMTGYDVSAEMLTAAESLARREGVRAQYILSDARRIRPVGGKADFALCVNDCLNYIPQSDVPAFFARVASALRRGGAFLFDVSSAHKLRDTIGNNAFCEDRDEVAWMWFNRLHEDRVEMDVTLFVREGDGRFSRRDEHHTQYIHKQDDLVSAARGAGFTVLSVEGGRGDASDDARRNFICKRN